MLSLDRCDDVTVVKLGGGKAHALDVETLKALEGFFEEAATSPARAVVLTADGSIFCAGLDLFRLAEGGAAYIRELLPALHAALRAMFAFPKPLVAAINGHALAGGCVIAAAADARVMARGPFKVGVTEILVGLPFPPSALGLMRHVCAPSAVQEVALTGRSWEPDEARARGLVDEVVAPEELLPRATEIARAFAAVPPAAFALTKKQIRSRTLEQIDRDQEALGAEIQEAWQSPKVLAAIREFVERKLKR